MLSGNRCFTLKKVKSAKTIWRTSTLWIRFNLDITGK